MASGPSHKPCCSVGARADVSEIDAALLEGNSLSTVAVRFGLPRSSVHRHKQVCLASVQDVVQGSLDGSGTPLDLPETGSGSASDKSPLKGVPNPQDDPPTAPKKVIAATIEERAVDLRIAGWSYRRIGAELGVDPGTAQDAVEKVLVRTVGRADRKAELARELEVQRCDEIINSLWSRATDPGMEKVNVPANNEDGYREYDGQDKATDRVLKAMERKSKLLGLDTAEKGMPFYMMPGFDEFLGRLLGPLAERFPEAAQYAFEISRDQIAMLAAQAPAKPGLRLIAGGKS